jgi:FHA domain/zinc-ribbon domain
MIVCPNCQHENITGAMFCEECGAPLEGDDLITEAVTDELITKELSRKAPRPEPAPPVTSWISLHFMDSGKILPLVSKNEFILGRLTDDSPILPDVDLTPYQASASGVSRLHAVVKRKGKRVVVMDFNSSNGTYINGRRIRPDVEETLRHGDIIALGALRIQILLHDV